MTKNVLGIMVTGCEYSAKEELFKVIQSVTTRTRGMELIQEWCTLENLLFAR